MSTLPRISEPPYKNSAGLWHTKQLFLEQWTLLLTTERVIQPLFSLYKDKPGVISGRKTFVELGDHTGYKWALKYLGDYEHWIYLQRSAWFREALGVWQNELEVKQTAEAIEVIRDIALSGDSKSALPAARYLAEQSWKKTRAGRPTKETISAELKKAVRERTEEDDDAARINLRLVTN